MADPNDVYGLDKQQKNILQYRNEMRSKYSLLFREGVGREVLSDILALCGFPGTTGSIHYGLDPDDKAMIGRFNVGVEIAERSGILKAIGTHIFGISTETKEV